MPKTTKAHFKMYKKSIKKWMGKYKITGWWVYYEHKDIDGDGAGYSADYRRRGVTFFLDTNWTDDPVLTKSILDRSARHEVIHLLIDPLYALATARFINMGIFERLEVYYAPLKE